MTITIPLSTIWFLLVVAGCISLVLACAAVGLGATCRYTPEAVRVRELAWAFYILAILVVAGGGAMLYLGCSMRPFAAAEVRP